MVKIMTKKFIKRQKNCYIYVKRFERYKGGRFVTSFVINIPTSLCVCMFCMCKVFEFKTT